MSDVVILIAAEVVLIAVIVSVIFWFFFRRPRSKQERALARHEFIPSDATRAEQERPPSGRRIAPAWLVVAEGETEGAYYPIEEATTLIGRSSVCDIIVTDPGVSRQHARIMKRGDEFFIHDLGSTNGTFVDGKIADPQQGVLLKHGSVISIGETVLVFTELLGKDSR